MKKTSPALQNITWFNQYATAIKVTLGAMVTFIVTTWGVFEYMDRKADKERSDDETIATIVEKQEVLLTWMFHVNGQLDTLKKSIDGVSDNVILVGNYVEGVNKAFGQHLKSSPEVSKEDYANLMFIVEELKKNGNLSKF